MLHGRVSRAADSLGVSQPAVSNALARLRRALGDELFTRSPRGMLPTPRALQLAPAVAQALSLLDAAVQDSERFEPSASTRQFTVGMTDIGEIVFLPRLLDHLAQVAPGVRLSTVRSSSGTLAEDMAAGRVDAAIGLLPQLQAGFYQRALFRQRYVCLYRRGHALAPAAGRRFGRSAFQKAGHVLVVSAGTGHGHVDGLMRRQGIERRIKLTVPHFVAVGHILARSDLVATVPERLAQHLSEPFGLAWSPHPAQLPDISINLFWHARQHQDEAQRWLREQLVVTLAGGAGG
jgi:DNA-binding transcriptional LysR family regulator